jgi:hypothetical protein
MVIKFTCECGNTDPNKTHFYDGCLGYEAIVCKCCGRYSDHSGSYPADNWSSQFTFMPVCPVHADEEKDE